MEPGISAENFVGALTGQNHLIIPAGLFAEINQRGVHVRHARQVMGVHRGLQTGKLILRTAFQIPVIRFQIVDHKIDIGPVLGGLEGRGLEITVVSRKVKGKRSELLASFFQLLGTYGRHQTAVHSAGEKRTDRYVGDHLPPNGIQYQFPGGFHRGRKIILMDPADQLPIAFHGDSVRRRREQMPGKQFLHAAKHAHAVGLCGADAENPVETPVIQVRLHAGKYKQALDLGRKNQIPVLHGVKERLYTAAIPEQRHPVVYRVVDCKGKNTVEPLYEFSPILHHTRQNHFRVAGGFKGPPLGCKIPAKFGGIVEFPVVYNRPSPSVHGSGHGLTACIQVDDCKPRVGQTNVGI
ncbi:hypothetical protein SDC9_106217 [bioreactor metagenome]|uniref:Uncharacterized protein n=1 Tax=bioreactor metagenome TaxID=1076179 RepID=A0A645B1P2_9ZZZZ